MMFFIVKGEFFDVFLGCEFVIMDVYFDFGCDGNVIRDGVYVFDYMFQFGGSI